MYKDIQLCPLLIPRQCSFHAYVKSHGWRLPWVPVGLDSPARSSWVGTPCPDRKPRKYVTESYRWETDSINGQCGTGSHDIAQWLQTRIEKVEKSLLHLKLNWNIIAYFRYDHLKKSRRCPSMLTFPFYWYPLFSFVLLNENFILY